MENPTIEQIFQRTDTNKDGGLDKNEFATLIKRVNPDIELNDEQVGLILDEVWKTYPSHVGPKGLSLEGLKKIYTEGLADPERDYDALIKAHRGSQHLEDELEEDTISHISNGRIGMAAATRQPALADASPSPATPPPASPDVFGGIITPAPPMQTHGKDIFDALQSPPTKTQDIHQLQKEPEKEDLDNALAFAIRLPNIINETEFNASNQRKELLSALQSALPDGSIAHLDPHSLLSTPTGFAVGSICQLPIGSITSEETEYFKAVMRVEPDQIFPLSSFGSVEVLSADVKAAGSASIAAQAATLVLSAATLAGMNNKVTMAFSVRLPKVTQKEFSESRGGQFMAQLRTALPKKAMARVVDVSPTPAIGCLITVAAAIPAVHAKQGQQLCRKLRQDPGSIFDSKVFGPPWMVALAPFSQLAPAIGVQVRLPPCQGRSTAAQKAEWKSHLLSSFEEMFLPIDGGSTRATLISMEDEEEEQDNEGGQKQAAEVNKSKGTIASIIAVVPSGIGSDDASLQRMYDRIQETMDQWCTVPPSLSSSSSPSPSSSSALQPRLLSVGPALESTCAIASSALPSRNDNAIKMKQLSQLKIGIPSPPRSRSASPVRRTPPSTAITTSPSLFGRLFGGNASTPTPKATASPLSLSSPPPPPPHPPAASASSPQSQAVIIAGYQRRASSSNGSSGLAEAVDETHLAADGGDSASSSSSIAAAAAALAAAAEVSPLKEKDGAYISASTHRVGVDIHVVAFAPPPPPPPPRLDEPPAVAEVVIDRGDNNNNDGNDKDQDGNTMREAASIDGDNNNNDADCEDVASSLSPEKQQQQQRGNGGWRSLLNKFSPRKKSRNAGDADGIDAHGVDSKNAREQQHQEEADIDGGNTTTTTTNNNNKQQQQQPPSQRKQLTPWEIQQRQNAKEWAVMDAQVTQIMAKLDATLDNRASLSANTIANDICTVQDTASLLPAWARHVAHMEIGEKLGQYNMYEEAHRSYKEAAAAWPEDPLARFRLANTLFALFQYHDASRTYFEAMRRCEESDPLLVKIHINMGISLESEGMMEAAEREYGRASVLAPNHPRVHKLLGSAKYACGDYDGAAEALNKALEVNPDFADAWADMGCTQAALGDAAEAERCLAVALDIDPNHIEAHFNMGNLLRQRYDFTGALDHYKTVLSFDPKHWRSLLNKSVVLAQLGWKSRGSDAKTIAAAKQRHHEAAQCLQQALLLSGHKSILVKEVDGLRQLMAQGAGLDEMSHAVSMIEDKARRATIVAAQTSNSTVAASHSMSLSATLGRTKSGGSVARQGSLVRTGSLAASITSTSTSASNATTATGTNNNNNNNESTRSPGRINSMARASSMQSSGSAKERVFQQRLADWQPLGTTATADDLSTDIKHRLESMGVSDIDKTLSVLDVPMLQSLQAVTNLSLQDIWNETQRCTELALFENSMPKSKLVTIQDANETVHRLLTLSARASPAPHSMRLAQNALNTMCMDVIALMDYNETGFVDLALLLCVMVSLNGTSPLRERLDFSYRLLMWRSSDVSSNPNGAATSSKGDPVTRGVLVELLSTLKMVFESEHKTSYMSQRRQRSAADTQFVLYERFASDIQRFFLPYEALPLLSNPLK